jgi:hypothetical protein
MLFKKYSAYSENHTKHANALCGQSEKFQVVHVRVVTTGL